MDAPPPRAAGTVIDGRLRLDARLDGWAAGETWRGQEIASGKPVVVKLVAPGGARRAERTGALRLLGDRLVKLQHPNVLATTAHGTQRGQVYFVHPWFEGDSLSARLRALAARGEHLPVAHARWVTEQLGEALAAIHRHAPSFLHGALTTDAVRVAWGSDGPTALRVHDIGLWLEAAAAPTPATAPELRRESPALHPTSDVYALASITAQLLAASLFEAPLDLDAPVETRLHALRAEAVDDALWSLLAQGLRHETQERPGSVEAFLAALRAVPWPADVAVAPVDVAPADVIAPMVMPDLPPPPPVALGFADPPQPLKPLQLQSQPPVEALPIAAPPISTPPISTPPIAAPPVAAPPMSAPVSYATEPLSAHALFTDESDRTEDFEHLRHAAQRISLDEAEHTAVVHTQHEFDRTSADMPIAPPREVESALRAARPDDTLNVGDRWPAPASPPPRAASQRPPRRRDTLMPADQAESTMDMGLTLDQDSPLTDGTQIIRTPTTDGAAFSDAKSRDVAVPVAPPRSALDMSTVSVDESAWGASSSSGSLPIPTSWHTPPPVAPPAPPAPPAPHPQYAAPPWQLDPYAQAPSSMGTTPLGVIPGWAPTPAAPPRASRTVWILLAVVIVMGALSFLMGSLLYTQSRPG